MQGRWALRRHPRSVHVAQDVRATTGSTRGKDSVRAELSGDVAIEVVAAAVVHGARRLVDGAVEDRNHGEHRFLRVKTLASHNDVELGVVVWSDWGVGAL